MSWLSDTVSNTFGGNGAGGSLLDPTNLLRNTLNQLTRGGTSPFDPLNGLRDLVPHVGTPNRTNGDVGSIIRQQGEDWKKKQLDGVKLDPVTRDELMRLNIPEFQTQFELAVNGDGKYGARKKETEHQLLAQNRPGAVQLFGNDQGRSAAQNGLLTSQSNGGLLSGSGFSVLRAGGFSNG